MSARRFFILVTVAFFLLVLAACGSDSDDSADGDAAESDGDAAESDGDGELTPGDEDGDVAESAEENEDAEQVEESDSEGETEVDAEQGLPDRLPFEFTRDPDGEPLSEAEIAAFTKKITGLWKQVDWFKWIVRISHGMHASTNENDYLVFWHDVRPVKSGDTVTWRHTQDGGAHNIMIPSPKILSQAMAGYLSTGDETMAYVTEQYCKGITATMKGMMWDENDPVKYLMARNIVNVNHEYEVDGGRKKAVDYTAWYNTYSAWNTARLHFPNNPYWGDIYVTNQRSKDDVPHIFTAGAWLPWLIESAQDEKVRSACAETWEYLQGFTKDIVDSGYMIRTKNENGEAEIPLNENGTIKDLASFVLFEEFIPNAECNAKLSSAIMSYGAPLENDCEYGFGGSYEGLATGSHYFNYAIIRNFHIAAILNTIRIGENEMALKLLEGLAQRIDGYINDDKKREQYAGEWDKDLAVYALQSAIVGLPLTAREARLVEQYYSSTVDSFSTWQYWDLWDESIPDGEYAYEPPTDANVVSAENVAFFLNYCWSPLKNPAGEKFVDCDIVLDPTQWGE